MFYLGNSGEHPEQFLVLRRRIEDSASEELQQDLRVREAKLPTKRSEASSLRSSEERLRIEGAATSYGVHEVLQSTKSKRSTKFYGLRSRARRSSVN